MKIVVTTILGCLILTTAAAQEGDGRIRVLLAGDSTVQDADHQRTPDWGWGQVLSRFFDDGVEVVNIAAGGRSTRTFIEEGRWDSLINLTRAGDYVFIQFGHNDPKEGNKYASPADYRRNLERFVDDARARGATPVLVTPVTRRRFDDEGNVPFTHGDYPGVVRDVAEAKNVPLADLKTKSRRILMEHGEEGSKRIYLHLAPGENPIRPDGLEDNTHFSEYGAMLMAGVIADFIRSEGLTPLADHLREPRR
ncbi:MAG: rhamnogalacturonan acetylesterase [Rikenellaceae bacterium]|nr:rhamnogalacturonan acetylesterase [Rikenellaceae bacterium]